MTLLQVKDLLEVMKDKKTNYKISNGKIEEQIIEEELQKLTKYNK